MELCSEFIDNHLVPIDNPVRSHSTCSFILARRCSCDMPDTVTAPQRYLPDGRLVVRFQWTDNLATTPEEGLIVGSAE